MSSQNYKLQGGNFNISAGETSSSGYRLSDLVGQTSAQIFTSKGYLIQSGYLNRAASSGFLFSVSPTVINFGSLTPEKETSKVLGITVQSGNFPGFIVYVAQDHPLTTEAGAEISDTLCDAAENKLCTKDKGNLWTKKSSTGFGFHLEGKTTPDDFNKKEVFRPFADLSKQELAIPIMESENVKASDTAFMTLKIIVSKIQAVGVYQNVLNLTAVPGI